MLLTNVTGNYFIKQNDTATEIHLAVTEVDGTPVDLSTAPRVEVVIGTILGRTLVKEPTLLSEPGELTFGLDPGDMLPVGDNLVEIHIYKENGEKRVAPSKGHYKMRVDRAIDDLEVVVTTITLDYFLAEVNRITFGLPEAVAEANELIIRSEQLITGAEIALQQAEAARDIAVEAVGVVEPLLDDMRDATSSANIAASLADGIATDLLGYNTAITDFSLATTYIKHQTVRANGSTYRAKVETQGNPLPVVPATSNQWFELVAAKGDTGPRGPEGQRGPTGATGATGTGLNFLGELDSVDDLPMANNNPGDTYFVGELIYTWSGTVWKKSEAVKGPQGDPGMNAKTIPLDYVVHADDASQVDDTLITVTGYEYNAETDSLQVYRNSRILYPGEDYVMENGSIRVLQPITQREHTTFYIHVRRSFGIIDEDVSKSNIIGALGYVPSDAKDTSKIDIRLNRGIVSSKTRKPMILIIDDDGRNQVVSRWEPILQEKDFTLDVAVITGWVGDSGYLSWEELERLKNTYKFSTTSKSKVDLVNHTHTHPYLASLTDEKDIRYQFENSTRILRDRGHSWDVMVYPYGSHNAKVREIAREYCRVGVHTDGGINVPPIDTFRIARYPLIPSSGTMESLEVYTNLIDEAIRINGFLVLMSHSQYEGFDAAKISAIIDYANSKDIEWVHMNEGLDRLGNAIDIGSYSERGAGSAAPAHMLVDADGNFHSNRYEWINLLNPNVLTDSSSITDFPKGTSKMLFYGSSQQFPVTSGTLITVADHSNQAYSYQLIFHASSNRIYRRNGTSSGTWGTFALIADEVKQFSYTGTIASEVPAGGYITSNFTIAGISNNDNIFGSPRAGIEIGLISEVMISGTDTVRVRIHNLTNAPISTNRVWKFTIVKT